MTTKVRDVMTAGPIAVEYDQPISEAARKMRDRDVGSLLVVRDDIVYGMVTDRDLVVRGIAQAKLADDPVGPLSSTDLVAVNADDDVAEALRLMREQAVRRLPVIDGGQVAGVVSLGDLAVAEA